MDKEYTCDLQECAIGSRKGGRATLSVWKSSETDEWMLTLCAAKFKTGGIPVSKAKIFPSGGLFSSAVTLVSAGKVITLTFLDDGDRQEFVTLINTKVLGLQEERPKEAASTGPENSVLEPYVEKSVRNMFKLLVNGGHVFYVNHYFLAEVSPVFEQLFFGDFKEAQEQAAHFPDENVGSFNLLFATLGMSRREGEKDIRVEDIGELLRLAHVFDIKTISKRCKEFIQKQLDSADCELPSVLHLCTYLRAVIDFGPPDYTDLKWHIANVLSTRRIAVLQHFNGWKEMRDASVVAAIIHASSKYSTRLEIELPPVQAFANSPQLPGTNGNCLECNQRSLFSCPTCTKAFCRDHLPQSCRQLQNVSLDRQWF